MQRVHGAAGARGRHAQLRQRADVAAATNPDASYPDSGSQQRPGNPATKIIPGFPFTIVSATTDGTRLRFPISGDELLRDRNCDDARCARAIFGPASRSLPISAAAKTGPSSNYGFEASSTKTKLPQPEIGLKFGPFTAEAHCRQISLSEIVNDFLADEASNRLIELPRG